MGDLQRALSTATRRRRRIRLWPLLGGILAAIVLLLAGVWLGGHPSVLPAPLRAGVFESRRGDIATEQALNILTSRYFRPLQRSTLVDLGLSGMVAGLEDPYSHYNPNRRTVPQRTGEGGRRTHLLNGPCSILRPLASHLKGPISYDVDDLT